MHEIELFATGLGQPRSCVGESAPNILLIFGLFGDTASKTHVTAGNPFPGESVAEV